MYLLIYVWFLCVSPQPSVATIKSYPSVPTPFSCKLSIATSLSCQSQAFIWKPLNVTPQSQAFSPKFSFATLQWQPVCCNFLFATFRPQPFIHKSLEVFNCNPSVSTLHSQSFSVSSKQLLTVSTCKYFIYGACGNKKLGIDYQI